jgi:hypothetical protein
MEIYAFGNPDLPEDSLPLRILPELKKKLRGIRFLVLDPNEEWDVPQEVTIIDTVQGIDTVKVFDDLNAFDAAPRVSMHDFDALANLRLLKKLGKIKNVKIIGLPPQMAEDAAVKAAAALLTST